jgi:hypothetical protein
MVDLSDTDMCPQPQRFRPAVSDAGLAFAIDLFLGTVIVAWAFAVFVG